jgi:hypothetical protein
MAELARVAERRRAVALAQHYRQFEGMSGKEIAQRLGRSHATIRSYFYDPDASKARAVKERYRGNCESCGAATSGGDGPGKAKRRCARCTPRGPGETCVRS